MSRERFPGRTPREGRIDTEKIDGFAPLLLQNRDELVAMLAAVRLLRDIAQSGGTVVSPQLLASLESKIGDAVPDSLHGTVDHELDSVVAWIEERLPDEEINPDVSHVRGGDASRWAPIVAYASERELDLRGEYYDPETETWPIVFGTPLFYDEHSAVIERVDGTFVTLLFRDTRWLMPVKARKKPKLADVLRFPGTEEE